MCNPVSYKPKEQSNRESYFIPEGVMHLKGYPLYILIAYWGLLRKEPFFRDDVARAFGLTERRAAGLMNYVHRKKDFVESTLKRVRVGAQGRNLKLKMQVKACGYIHPNNDGMN